MPRKPTPVLWECLQCARKCNLVDDDCCPTCGKELPSFAEFRTDGWPLCPQCGEDELYSLLTWLGEGDRPPLEAYLKAGLHCYRCDFLCEPSTGDST